MVFRSHRFRIIIRILLITLFIAICVVAAGQEKWYVATGVSAGIVILLIVELFRYIDRSNRDFIHLLQSMKYRDFTKSYRGKSREKSFRELESSFNEILAHYQEIRMEKEIQYQYLQTVIDHIQLAMICFNQEGQIILYNTAAGKLFQKSHPDRLESLSTVYPALYELMLKLGSGQKDLIKVNREGDLLQLAVTATEFRLKSEQFKLVSLQDIKHELEEQELESWQKLIRVLTHEIMNSVTPISSLSMAVNAMMVDKNGGKRKVEGLDEGDLEDMYSSLETIEERSRGLLKFVGDYKNVTRLPKPAFEDLDVNAVIAHVQQLFKEEIENLPNFLLSHIKFKDL